MKKFTPLILVILSLPLLVLTSYNLKKDINISQKENIEEELGAVTSSWSRRQKIEINPEYIDSSLSNFPVLITEGSVDSSIFTEAKSDGCDIRVTSDIDGNLEQPLELVSFNTSSSTLEIWTSTSTLSSSATTTMYLWWGNASASCYTASSTYGAEAVWDSNYKAVWHMQETSGTRYDSTSNDNDLTDHATVDYDDGKFGGNAAKFTSANSEWLDIAGASQTGTNLVNDFTLSLWGQTTDVTATWIWFIRDASGTGDLKNWRVISNSTGVGFDTSPNGNERTTSVLSSNNTWYQLVAKKRSTGVGQDIYLDGISKVSASTKTGDTTGGVYDINIGRRQYTGSNLYLDGLIDEVRIYDGVQTDDWTEAEYDNQNIPASFALGFGAVNTSGGASAPTVTTQAVSSIASTTATYNGNITATGGASSTHRGFVWDTSSKSAPGNVAPVSSGYSDTQNESGTFQTGAFSLNINSLSPSTTYYVRAYASSTGGFGYGGEVSYTTSATSSNSISLTDVTDGRIIQRTSNNTGSLTATGTYSGVPTAIEARVINATSSAEILAWTTLDASPSGNTFSGTLSNIPQGGWYNVQVRFSNEISTTDNGTNDFAIGILIGTIGQSNIEQWFVTGSATANSLTKKYTDSGWVTMTTSGAVAFANKVNSGSWLPVGVLDYAVGGTSLLQQFDSGLGYWLDTSKGSIYDDFTDAVTALGGTVEFIVWGQGERDGANSASTTAYQNGLGTLMTNLRSDVNAVSGTLPVIFTIVGKYTGQSDSGMQNVRDAQYAYIASDNNSYIGSQIIDLPLDDTVHLTTAGYTTHGQRMAQTILYLLGEETYYRGSIIRDYEEVTNQIVNIRLTHNSGTDFTPTSGITGFEILDNGSAETISSAVRQDATTIKLTISGTLTEGNTTVRYLYGADPTTTSVVKDNSGMTLPLESKGAITERVYSTLYPSATFY